MGYFPIWTSAFSKHFAPTNHQGLKTYPDHVSAIERDGITTENVLGVELGDVDVLDDDVLGAVGHAQTLATDDTLGANTNDGLVGADGEAGNTSSVVLDSDGGGAGTGVAVVAPAGVVDGILATVTGALVGGGTAALLGGGALGANVVEPGGGRRSAL